MSEKQYVMGKCKQCGEELRVPDTLKEFSCMYCGTKLKQEDLLSEILPVEMESDTKAVMDMVFGNIARCVTEHTNVAKSLTKLHYEESFKAYTQTHADVFENLDLACRIDPQHKEQYISQSVDSFIDTVEASWAKTKGRTAQASQKDDNKMAIATFMVPMVGYLQLSISQEFCETLQITWAKRFPKNLFYIGTYEAISTGFRKFKLCFITTAICENQGKADDCLELTAFRAFRDGYLMSCPDGKSLIEQYYQIAPVIVENISAHSDSKERYDQISTQYLQPCYEDLQKGNLAQCKEHYTKMVRDLQKQYS